MYFTIAMIIAILFECMMIYLILKSVISNGEPLAHIFVFLLGTFSILMVCTIWPITAIPVFLYLKSSLKEANVWADSL